MDKINKTGLSQGLPGYITGAGAPSSRGLPGPEDKSSHDSITLTGKKETRRSNKPGQTPSTTAPGEKAPSVQAEAVHQESFIEILSAMGEGTVSPEFCKELGAKLEKSLESTTLSEMQAAGLKLRVSADNNLPVNIDVQQGERARYDSKSKTLYIIDFPQPGQRFIALLQALQVMNIAYSDMEMEKSLEAGEDIARPQKIRSPEQNGNLALFEKYLGEMVEGEKAREAIPRMAPILQKGMRLGVLKRLKRFGLTFDIPAQKPGDWQGTKQAGEYSCNYKKVTIPFNNLTEHILIHEMGHAYDHFLEVEDINSRETDGPGGLFTVYEKFHSNDDQEMKDAYHYYRRRVEALDTAREAYEGHTSAQKAAAPGKKIKPPAGCTVEQLPDGRLKIEIARKKPPRKELLKLAGVGVLTTLAGGALIAAGTVLAPCFALALPVIGAGAIKTYRDFKKAPGIQQLLQRAQKAPHTETLTLPVGRKIEFHYRKDKDTVILPAKFKPREDFDFVRWTEYAYDQNKVSEYYAESAAYGPQNLEARDPAAFTIYQDIFQPPPPRI